jgi:predicted dehydrogenase
MLNAAIVGLGWWGKKLTEAVKGSPLIRFTHGVTLEPELAAEFCTANGLTLTASVDAVLTDPSIQAVILATPHTTHRKLVEKVAAARKHVFCEKPFALSKADAQAAVAACRSAGVALGVGQNFRFLPSIAALRELVASGALGTIMHAEGNYSHDWLAGQGRENWRTALEESRAGGMTGMGIHVLDSFSYLVGPMKRVSALSRRRVLDLPAGDSTAALVDFANGATGVLGTTLKTPYIWRLAVFGENVWAESVNDNRLIIHRSTGEPEVRDFTPVVHQRANLESFANAALGNGPFQIDDAGIVHTVAALEAVFKSVDADGAWQEV